MIIMLPQETFLIMTIFLNLNFIKNKYDDNNS